MERLTRQEALQRFPFVAELRWPAYVNLTMTRVPKAVELFLTDFDDAFKSHSLLEEDSPELDRWDRCRLYVVRSDRLSAVSVRRLTATIYPAEYLRSGFGPDYPDDVRGWSETVGEALGKDLSGVQYVVLHEYGEDQGKHFNRITVASVIPQGGK